MIEYGCGLRFSLRGAETLVQVRADGRKPFTAGLIFTDDRCTLSAPILRKFCLGRTKDECRELFRERRWKAVVIKDHQAISVPP